MIILFDKAFLKKLIQYFLCNISFDKENGKLLVLSFPLCLILTVDGKPNVIEILEYKDITYLEGFLISSVT